MAPGGRGVLICSSPMAGKYGHPFPVEGGRLPFFDIQHEARDARPRD